MRSREHLSLSLGVLFAAGCGMGKPTVPVPEVRSGKGDERAAIQQQKQPDSPPIPPREQVENPQYASWSAFPTGTIVVLRSVTETAGNPAVTTTTKKYRLVELTPDHAVVDVLVRTKRYDGAEINNPPEKFTFPKLVRLPPGVAKDDFGKPVGGRAQEQETVKIGDQSYAATLHEGKDRNEAGEVFIKVWTSASIPGGLVKSIARIPAVGKTTTIEIVEVKVAPRAEQRN